MSVEKIRPAEFERHELWVQPYKQCWRCNTIRYGERLDVLIDDTLLPPRTAP